MRPHKLKIRAFGSYMDEEIDFESPRTNMFLVSGNTGSGKSTIFDAMYYALYGERTVDDADKKDILCNYAAEGAKPEVELTFTVGDSDEEYTIVRSAEHWRASKRKGKDPVLAKGEVDFKGPGIDVSSSKKAEIDKKIVDVVGLTKDQFRQVAMIAQGEFRELLRMDTKDRQVIFRKLFGTQIFDGITKRLQELDKQSSAKMEQISTQIVTISASVVIPENYPEHEGIAAMQASLAQDNTGPALKRFEDALNALGMWQADETRDLKEDEAKKKRAYEKARKSLIEANTLAQSFADRKETKSKLNAHLEREKDMHATESLAQQMEDAGEVRKAWDGLDTATKNLENTQRELESTRERLPKLKEAVRKGADKEREAQKTLDDGSGAWQATITRAEEDLQRFDKLDEAAKKEKQCGARTKKAESELASIKAGLTKAEEDIRESTKQKNELDALEKQELALAPARKQAQDLKGALRSIDTALKGATISEQAFEQAKEMYLTAKEAYMAAKKAHDDASAAYFDNAAGVLAERLVEGKPCPVCGATDHPHPAVQDTASGAPNLEQVKDLRAQAEQKQQVMMDASEASAKAGEASAQKQSVVEEKTKTLIDELIQAELTSNTNLELEAARQIVADFGNRTQREVRKVQNRKKELANAAEELEAAKQRKTALEEREEKATEANKLTAAQQAAAKAERESIENEIVHTDRESAQNERAQAQKSLKQAQNALIAAQNGHRKAQKALSECEGKEETLAQQIPGLQQQCNEQQQKYAAALQEHKLEDGAWQPLATPDAAQKARTMRQQVKQWEEEKALLSGQLTKLEQLLAGKEEPDIAKLTSEAQQYSEAAEKATQAMQTMLLSVSMNAQAKQGISTMLAERSKIAGEYDKVHALAQKVAGKEKAGKMSLETYAQRYYLSKILLAANERFAQMSNGQFELRMVDEKDANAGRDDTGLELRIHSFATGTDRDVRSLSGGESFMAALSLALGMADTIQANSSSVHLDVMFVDEGFGSLDEDTCRQAVQSLKRMAGDSTLVGIISHVGTLKQTIDDQLVVTRDKTGSHTKWQNG